MKRLLLLVVLAAPLAIVGCTGSDELPRYAAFEAEPVASTTPAGPTTESDVIAKHEATVELELVSTADVALIEHRDGSLDVSIRLDTGGKTVSTTKPLTGTGKVVAFPEANVTMYVAKLDAPALPGGRCGDQPVSVALSLRRVGSNAHVSGALTAYCGAGKWYGAPVQALRLAGALPP